MTQEHAQYMQAQLKQIETALDQLAPQYEQAERQKHVVDAMRYALEAGGKRIRPFLVLEFCKLCGGTAEQAMAPACALEMIHTFSLIHDDLPAMDNDDYRRGKPSCHKAFGEATAILAGDGLSVHAVHTILQDSTLKDAVKLQLVRVLMDATGYLGMIGGQVMDMENEQRSDVQVEDLQVMCAAKTGALIRAACKMGCIAAGASEETIQQADHYGACLGLAFQIVDDILDVTSTTEVLGKPVGSDAAEHKQTFVTLLGIDAAREEANRLTQEAIEALQPFAEHAVLVDLTKELLERKK